MMKFVDKLLAARPYRLTLRFTTGEVRTVDLEPMLRTKGACPRSAYSRLLDPATFCRARLDAEGRTACWDGLAIEIGPDGIERSAPLDLCPDFLYEVSAPLAEEGLEPGAEYPRVAEVSGLGLKEDPPRGE